MAFERHRIVAADDESDVAARKTARLTLERHARVGDRRHLGLQAAFPFDAGDRPILLQRQERIPAADIDVVKGILDHRVVAQDGVDLVRDRLAL